MLRNHDSGEPVQMYRLTRVFAAHIHKVSCVDEDSYQNLDL